MFGAYQRLKLHLSASDMDVIRAARKRIARMHWRNPAMRDQRHAHYRTMLTFHHKCQHQFRIATGR